jgi:hypothetical protein
MREGKSFVIRLRISVLFFLQARFSAQRKELFKTVQVRKGFKPVQLLLDMTVRWDSTYIMLYRAKSRKDVCSLLDALTTLICPSP